MRAENAAIGQYLTGTRESETDALLGDGGEDGTGVKDFYKDVARQVNDEPNEPKKDK